MFSFDSILAFLGLVLGFSFLIFVHELGHFAVAKLVGIKVTQFAIGFGNAACSFRKGIGLRFGSTEKEYARRIEAYLKDHPDQLQAALGQAHETEHHGSEPDTKATPPSAGETSGGGGVAACPDPLVSKIADTLGLGETEYRLNTLPLGGYVKMLGQEDMDPAARSNDPRAFNSKSIMARFWVLSAGVIMNLIFGAILLAWAFTLGVDFPGPVIGGVAPGSPAATTYALGHDKDPAYQGLRVGDTIIAVNDKPASDMMALRIATALGKAGQIVPIEVRREGVEGTLTYPVIPKVSKHDKLLSAGISPAVTLEVASVKRGGKIQAAVASGSALADAGVVPGMSVTAVGSRPVSTFAQYRQAVIDGHGQPVELTLSLPDGVKTVTAPVQATPLLTTGPQDSQRNLLGLVPAVTVTPTPQSPALAAGVRAGDVIARAGELDYPAIGPLAQTIQAAKTSGLNYHVLRDGKIIDLGVIKPKDKRIGIHMFAQAPVISTTLSGSAAAAMEEAGDPLPPGTVITQVNDQPVNNWADLQRQMQAAVTDAPAEALKLTYQTPLPNVPAETVTLALTAPQAQTLASAGWAVPLGIEFKPYLVSVKATGPLDALKIGLVKTNQFMVQTYVTLVRLFEGSVKPEHLRGPVGIVDEGTRIATRGFSYLLFFLGLISVNLAVINYLPIPIVDGGHIVFLIIEKLKGSPVSPAIQTWASIAGLVLIGLVFITTLYYDVDRLTGVFSGLLGS